MGDNELACEQNECAQCGECQQTWSQHQVGSQCSHFCMNYLELDTELGCEQDECSQCSECQHTQSQKLSASQCPYSCNEWLAINHQFACNQYECMECNECLQPGRCTEDCYEFIHLGLDPCGLPECAPCSECQ